MRTFSSLLLASLLVPGCAAFQKKEDKPSFDKRLTPAGEYCSDMRVVFNGDPEPDRPFHRVKTVRTALVETTAPERLQLLREVACDAKGDAVIDAGDYEGTAPDGRRVKFLAGTVVQWTTATNDATPGGITAAPRPAISAPAKKAPATIEKDELDDEEAKPEPTKATATTKKKRRADD